MADIAFSTTALWSRCPPLHARPDPEAMQRRSHEYRLEQAAYNDGWQASRKGFRLSANPHLENPLPRVPWAWAKGHEDSASWHAAAGPAARWLIEGKSVRIKDVTNPTYKGCIGKNGTIKTVHRGALQGSVVVLVPPIGRQKKSRDLWYSLKDIGMIEPEPEEAEPAEPNEQNALTYEQFTGHLDELRAQCRWADAARIVQRAFDLMPVGTVIVDSLGHSHTKTKEGGQNWMTVASRSRTLLAGPRRGQTIEEQSVSQGNSWNFAVDLGWPTRNSHDHQLLNAAYDMLASANALPAMVPPQAESRSGLTPVPSSDTVAAPRAAARPLPYDATIADRRTGMRMRGGRMIFNADHRCRGRTSIVESRAWTERALGATPRRGHLQPPPGSAVYTLWLYPLDRELAKQRPAAAGVEEASLVLRPTRMGRFNLSGRLLEKPPDAPSKHPSRMPCLLTSDHWSGVAYGRSVRSPLVQAGDERWGNYPLDAATGKKNTGLSNSPCIAEMTLFHHRHSLRRSQC